MLVGVFRKMFNFFKQRKIRTQLQVFLKWRRRRNMSLSDYEAWLGVFLAHTEKDDIFDVNGVDVLEFTEFVRTKWSGEHFPRRAEVCLTQFMRFYTARGKMMTKLTDYNNMLIVAGVGYVADIKRNKEIVRLYIKDQQLPPEQRKWSLRRLADEYGIHYTRVSQIIRRDREKYGPTTRRYATDFPN